MILPGQNKVYNNNNNNNNERCATLTETYHIKRLLRVSCWRGLGQEGASSLLCGALPLLLLSRRPREFYCDFVDDSTTLAVTCALRLQVYVLVLRGCCPVFFASRKSSDPSSRAYGRGFFSWISVV